MVTGLAVIRTPGLLKVVGGLWLGCAPALAAVQAPAEVPRANDPVQEAIEHVRNLEYDPARRQLEAWLVQHPDDLRALSYLASAMLQEELFRRDLLESRAYAAGGDAFRDGKPPVSAAFQQELFATLNKLESRAEERVRANPRDDQALYWHGTAHAARAIYHLAVTRAHTTALGEAKEARRYHAQVLSLNPSFVDALLLVGIYDYIAGSIPWYLKVFATIAGFRGDKERGLASIARVTREGNWAKPEARQFLAIFYYREKRYAETLALLEEMGRAYPRNFIIPQEIARTYKAQGNWRLAAETYESLLARYRRGEPGYQNLPVSKVLYQAGEAYANLGDTARALRLYEEAAQRQENNIFVYRAVLAAGGVYQQLNRPEDARRHFERVASAIPATEEGKAARQHLKQLR
jgi:tetratricopeptide (TPR) repeat protein